MVELGCGTAQWVAALAGDGARVLGLDASSAMLKEAQTRAASQLARATASQLPLRTASCAGLCEEEGLEVHAFLRLSVWVFERAARVH